MDLGPSRRPPGAINTPKWRAVRYRVPCDIEIHSFAGIQRKLRIRKESKPCDRVERCASVSFHSTLALSFAVNSFSNAFGAGFCI